MLPDPSRKSLLKTIRRAAQGISTALICIMSLLLIAPSHALEFQCEIEGETRYLRLEIPGQQRLCEVSVNYKNTGERRVMWYADKDSLFCSAKIYALRDKYENQWKFNCEQWPDLDGIDQLSPSNRKILDTQLKELIEDGRNSSPQYRVEAVKAVASNLFDKQPGTLALQFFLSTGDVTQIITDDGNDWNVVTTVKDLAAQINSDTPVTAAYVQSITDSGALEISTTIASEDTQHCFGNQVLVPGAENTLEARTSHEYICNAALAQ